MFKPSWSYAYSSIAIIFSILLIIYILSIYPPILVKTKNMTKIELNIFEKIDKNNYSVSEQNNLKVAENVFVRNENRSGKFGKLKHHVPKFMLDLYEESRNQAGKLEIPDVVRSVIPRNSASMKDPEGHPWSSLDSCHLLEFIVPRANHGEEFLSAELRVLTIIDKDSLEGVEKLILVSIYNNSKLLPLQQLHVSHSEDTWITFNVTGAVNLTSNMYPKSQPLTIVICIESVVPFWTESNKTYSMKLSLTPKSEEYHFEHDYPILLLSYSTKVIESNRGYKKKTKKYISGKINDSYETQLPATTPVNSTKRYKRNSNAEDFEEEMNKLWDDDDFKGIAEMTRKQTRARNSCRRRTLYVDFAEINYDSWIVQPRGYEAYRCSGKCFYPVSDHLSPTKHAIVQALLHSVAPAKAPRSCCVPTSLNSISVLYIDHRGVLTYRFRYHDMVVGECGCR